MYYQIGSTFEEKPVLEITYDTAWELTKEEYESRKETLHRDEVVREAKRIINPTVTYL